MKQSQSINGQKQSQSQHSRKFSFAHYKSDNFFDEMFGADGQERAGYAPFRQRVEQLTRDEMLSRQQAAERTLMSMGITFNVYSEGEGTERIMPIDIIPRIIEAAEWDQMEQGLVQRIKALNLIRQPRGGRSVALGHGRRAVKQRVGKNSGEEQPGNIRRWNQIALAAGFRHQGAGAADRLHDKWDWGGSWRISEAVVVQHADDLRFLRARDRLRQLIVIYQNQLRFGGLQKTLAAGGA